MQTVIVTGAAGNLGAAVVKKMLEANFHVTGIFSASGQPTIQQDHFTGIVADLTSESAAASVVEEVVNKNKRIDAGILTVGGFAKGTVAETTTGEIKQQIQLNFETTYNMARPLFTQMMKQGYGRIFMIGSKPGLSMHNGKGMLAYSLAKSLVFRLAELMNDEAKGKNIVVSVVIPSTIDTAQNRKSMPDADFTKWVQPAAIAEIIRYHCSAEADVLRETVIKVYNNA